MNEFDIEQLTPEDVASVANALAEADGVPCETALGSVTVTGAAHGPRLLLCHGAGAGHDSEFLEQLRAALVASHVCVVAIEFSYMGQMRREQRRRPPPKIERLVAELAEWQRALQTIDPETPLWLGGKSMGGRAASLLAAEAGADGLVLLGYPFHPPATPERLRLDHWPRIDCPLLLIQGTRDPFGRREEVESYTLPAHVECHFLEGGDHDWQPRKRQPESRVDLIDRAAALVARRLGASG
ncbi:alpha/beta family hydrolase [Salinicola aestuarinus]|uniref:alpha/beta family hydrolase n=1 Tax=Salinicola aestuarinus TaxID=1949082 RepID=UPI000DA1ADA2|nr:alpha/beta family hydrolase [Salinicola aestuarinus]